MPRSGRDCCGSNKDIRRRRQGLNLVCVIPPCGVLIRGLQNLESPQRNVFTFFSLLRKERGVAEGPRPSRLPENGSKLYRIVFSCCFRLSSLNQHVVRPAFSDVLNRCERVIAVQTQDRYFSKMGSHTTSLQEQAAFEKGGCSLSLLRWEFVFAVCGLKVLS